MAWSGKRNYIAKDSKEGWRSSWPLEAFPMRGWDPPREPVFRKYDGPEEFGVGMALKHY